MALVGGVVADRGERGDLALAVQGGERAGGGVPHQRGVLGERLPGPFGEADRGAQVVVERFLDGGEHRQGVPPAFHEDRHQHRLVGRGGGRLGDARFEVAGRERGGAVDRERGTDGPQQEGAPVHPGAGGQRLPGLDRRQSPAGGGDAAAQQVGAVEVVAGAAWHVSAHLGFVGRGCGEVVGHSNPSGRLARSAVDVSARAWSGRETCRHAWAVVRHVSSPAGPARWRSTCAARSGAARGRGWPPIRR